MADKKIKQVLIGDTLYDVQDPHAPRYDETVKYSDAIANTNPFGGKRLYINNINNSFYDAPNRWNVTVTEHKTTDDDGNTYPRIKEGAVVTDDVYYEDGPIVQTYTASAMYLFDNNYEWGVAWNAGNYLKVRIDTGDNKKVFYNYPYGKYYLSFYHNLVPLKAEWRCYTNYETHGLGWHLGNFYYYNGNASSTGNVILWSSDESNMNRHIIEFIIYAKADNRCRLTQVEWNLSRPNATAFPTTDKFSDQLLKHQWSWGDKNNSYRTTINNGNVNTEVLKASNYVEGKTLVEDGKQLPQKYMQHRACTALDADQAYSSGLYGIKAGTNVPDGKHYGSLLSLPYRNPYGGTIPDYGSQIYIPCGDDSTESNQMFFRSSLSDKWLTWQKVVTTSSIKDIVEDTLTPASNKTLYSLLYKRIKPETANCSVIVTLCNVKSTATDEHMIYGHIRGHGHTSAQIVDSVFQFYNNSQNEKISNPVLVHRGLDFGNITIYQYDGKWYMQFIVPRAYSTFEVIAVDSWEGYTYEKNIIQKIEAGTIPTSGVTRKLEVAASYTPKAISAECDGDGKIIKNTYALKTHDHAEKYIYQNSGNAGISLIDRALVGKLRPNRFFGLKAEGVTIEYSVDGGTTWLDYEADDAKKRSLFSGPDNTGYLQLGKNSTVDYKKNMLRVTVDSVLAGVYTQLMKFCLFISTNGANGCYVKIEGAKVKDLTTFNTLLDRTDIAGWSGDNIINCPLTTYGGGGTTDWASEQIQLLRFVFGQDGEGSTANLIIQNIYGYGGVGWAVPSTMAKSDLPFNVQYDSKISLTNSLMTQAVLPQSNRTYNLGGDVNRWKEVHAVKYYESGSSLETRYAAKLHTHNVSGKVITQKITYSDGELFITDTTVAITDGKTSS